MIGSLLRIGLLTTLVGGSAVALVGSDRLAMYVHHGKQAVLSAIDEVEGLETKLSLIRERLGSLDGELKELRERQIRFGVEVERLEGRLAERREALERRARVLAKARALLAEGRQRYVIGGIEYTRDEVERDAQAKLDVYEVQSKTLRSLEQTLETKRRALALARESAEQARALRARLAAKLDLLSAQLDKLRAKQALVASVGDLVDTDDLDSDVAEVRHMIDEFEEKLEVEERSLDARLAAPAESDTAIDYEAEEPTGSGVTDRIDRVLNAADAAATIVVH